MLLLLSYDCVYDSNVVIHLTDTFIQANLMVQFTGKQAEKISLINYEFIIKCYFSVIDTIYFFHIFYLVFLFNFISSIISLCLYSILLSFSFWII